MRNNYIEYVAYEKFDLLAPLEGAFYFRPKGRFIWLQKLCNKIIFKLGGFDIAVTHETKYRKRTINTDDFFKLLFEQYKDLRINYDKAAQRILIGEQDFNELMGYNDEFRKHITLQYHQRVGRTGGYFLMELTVEIIPWMRGIVVMP